MANYNSYYSEYYSTGSHANAYFEDTERRRIPPVDRQKQQTIGGTTDILGNYQGSADEIYYQPDYDLTIKSGKASNINNPANDYGGTRDSLFYESDVNFIHRIQNKRMTTQTVGGATAILNDYVYEDQNVDVERQTANIAYMESVTPLYDPYQSNPVGAIASNPKMMQPQYVEYNNIQQAPVKPQWAPNTLKTDRIEVLKKEIQELNAEEINRAKHKRSRRRCCCCPQTRMGLIVCVVSILLFLLLLGLLIWIFFPK
jgi:hypothetical protein